MSPGGMGQQTSENEDTDGRNASWLSTTPPDAGDEPPDRQPEHRHAAEMGGYNASLRDPPEARSRHKYYGELVSARPYEMATFASLIAARAAVERSEWQDLLSRGEVDRCGRGVIDERGKSFSPAERRIAEYLAGHGPAVVSVSEGYGVYGRTPDARVNDIPVEFKSLDPGASDRTVKAALNSAKGASASCRNRCPGLRADRGRSQSRYPTIQRNAAWRPARCRVGHRSNEYIEWRRTG